MRCPATVTLILTSALTASAQEERAHFDQGRRRAEQGQDAREHFARASAELAQHASVNPSPEAFLNLGNAAFLADDLPRAIWAFRRGLALAPQHRRLREHLEHARAQVAQPRQQNGQPEPDPWPAWLPRWGGCAWLGLSGGAYAAACGAGVVWLIARRRGWLLTSGVALGIAVLGGYGWSIGYSECRREARMPSVVIQHDGIALRTGNGPSYPPHPDLPTLYAGMEARRLAERGGWLQIQFASGDMGWVAREHTVNGSSAETEVSVNVRFVRRT